LLLCSSYLPLGVPNWTVIYINTPCRINDVESAAGVEVLGVMTSNLSQELKFLGDPGGSAAVLDEGCWSR
jgi:hypothetical protein